MAQARPVIRHPIAKRASKPLNGSGSLNGSGPGQGRCGGLGGGMVKTAQDRDAPDPAVPPAALREERRGEVLILTLTHPPVNAINATMRAGLAVALTGAKADHGIKALVITGEGQGFSAGADIAEFGRVNQTLELGALCLMIETLGKPVIAALHGAVLGGGLELALASHHRLALANARLGLPEVNLGLLPGAGGTQRLPRLIGAVEALRLILTGAQLA